MKILLLSDLHLLDKSPANRVDNIIEAQKDKISQLLDIYEKEGCSFILQAGDFWDVFNPSLDVLSYYIMLFRKYSVRIYCVAGQHDLYMHSLKNIDKTALKVMEASGNSFILDGKTSHKGINIYGCSYGQKVPKIDIDYKHKKNVLVVHKLISPEKLFPQQELMTPKQFVRNNPGWDVILCGDYHYHFFERYGGTVILNTGCMTRKTIGQKDLELKPCVYVWDVEMNRFKRVFLKVASIENVFDLSSKKQGKNRINVNLERFISNLKRQKGLEISFRDNLEHFFRENRTDKEVRETIMERLNE